MGGGGRLRGGGGGGGGLVGEGGAAHHELGCGLAVEGVVDPAVEIVTLRAWAATTCDNPGTR